MALMSAAQLMNNDCDGRKYDPDEGRTVAIEYRWAEGRNERMQRLRQT